MIRKDNIKVGNWGIYESVVNGDLKAREIVRIFGNEVHLRDTYDSENPRSQSFSVYGLLGIVADQAAAERVLSKVSGIQNAIEAKRRGLILNRFQEYASLIEKEGGTANRGGRLERSVVNRYSGPGDKLSPVGEEAIRLRMAEDAVKEDRHNLALWLARNPHATREDIVRAVNDASYVP